MKLYESVSPGVADDLAAKIAQWKRIADTSRDLRKIRFAEQRMVYYANLRNA